MPRWVINGTWTDTTNVTTGVLTANAVATQAYVVYGNQSATMTGAGYTTNVMAVEWRLRPAPPPPAPLPPEEPRASRLARARAKGKALALLQSLVTPVQWTAWRGHRAFEVVGSDGRCYRLRHGIAGNVIELDSVGQARTRWCAHPTGDWLPEDVVIAQLLALTHDAEAFRRVANPSRAA